jgi:hypothetical protein
MEVSLSLRYSSPSGLLRLNANTQFDLVDRYAGRHNGLADINDHLGGQDQDRGHRWIPDRRLIGGRVLSKQRRLAEAVATAEQRTSQAPAERAHISSAPRESTRLSRRTSWRTAPQTKAFGILPRHPAGGIGPAFAPRLPTTWARVCTRSMQPFRNLLLNTRKSAKRRCRQPTSFLGARFALPIGPAVHSAIRKSCITIGNRNSSDEARMQC